LFCRKNQKLLVDHIKIVIKSGNKNTAEEKVRSIKVLNKAICKAHENHQFLRYVQVKIMDRLTILAKYCPKNKNPGDFANLITRGSHIFSQDEKDTKNASAFLIVLLDCIERWGKAYRKDF
jgi:hypothetical protein